MDEGEKQRRRRTPFDQASDVASRLILFLGQRTFLSPLAGLSPIVLTVFGVIILFVFLIVFTSGGLGPGGIVPGGGPSPTPAPIAGGGVDQGLTNANGMTVEQIAEVLDITPLNGTAQTIWDAAQKYQINPALVLAIGKQESGFGKAYEKKLAGSAPFNDYYHNPWGILNTTKDAYGNFHHRFSSWEESIARQTGVFGIYPLLRNVYFNQRGVKTIVDIKAIYAPDGATNDPEGLNSSWLRNVTKYYNEFYQNRLLAKGACAAIGIPRHAADIADNLQLGCGGRHNLSPDYPELYNPTTCGAGGSANELFWCTWLVLKSFDRSNIKLPQDWLSTVTMESSFREKGWFMPPTTNASELETGDILFMNNNKQHVGIVYLITDSYVIAKESNSTERSWHYAVENGTVKNNFISGFGRYPCGLKQ